MKRRLRKKLRLREFQQMGFATDFTLSLASTSTAESTFWRKLIEFVEAEGLEIGGSLSSFYVVRTGRGTATDTDRENLATWLRQQPEVTIVNVWPLDDAWHGPYTWL